MNENNQLCKALHIELPGYVTHYKPEDTIELKLWVGSEYIGIYDDDDEIKAAKVLKAIGWADSTYVLKKVGKHYVLYSPEQSWKVWSWSAYYRIGPWNLVENK